MAFPLLAVLGLGLAGVSAFGQFAAGKEQARMGELTSRSTLAQRDIERAGGREQMATFLDNVAWNTSANEAFFSFAGRDIGSDMSVDAYMAEQARTAAEDAGATARNMENVANQRTLTALSAQAKGQAALGAGIVKGMGTLISGFSNFAQVLPAPAAPSVTMGGGL